MTVHQYAGVALFLLYGGALAFIFIAPLASDIRKALYTAIARYGEYEMRRKKN